jgi:hypothetical protein
MDENALRAQLAEALAWRGAHLSFDQAVKGFPAALIGARVPGLAHSAWQLVSHLRLTQWDILEFSRDPAHKSPQWPEGYWPADDVQPSPALWDDAVGKFRADLKSMIELVNSRGNDLFAPIPHGQGQTLFREAILLIDHNSYHVGQVVDLRRLLGIAV